MADFEACGWRVRSQIALPEIAPWRGDARAPDIDIRLGPVMHPAPSVDTIAPQSAIDDDGAVYFTAPGVARYAIRGGRDVTVEPFAAARELALRTCLYGTVLGVLCHQRGLCRCTPGLWHSAGAQSSSPAAAEPANPPLAASLVRQGARLLAEDLCPLSMPRPAARDDLMVLPSIPRFRLNRDMIDHLGLAHIAPSAALGDTDKHAIAHAPALLSPPARPVAIYHIDRTLIADRPRTERVWGIEALELVRNAVYRWELAHAMGRSQAVLLRAADLVAAIPCFRLWRTPRLAGIDAMASLILERETTRC